MKYLKNIIKNIIYLLKHDIKLVIRVNRQTNKINELEKIINELEKKINSYLTSNYESGKFNKRVTNKGI